jgi:hypothetical protein
MHVLSCVPYWVAVDSVLKGREETTLFISEHITTYQIRCIVTSSFLNEVSTADWSISFRFSCKLNTGGSKLQIQC